MGSSSPRLRGVLSALAKLAIAVAMFVWLSSKGLLNPRAVAGLPITSLASGFVLLGLQGTGSTLRQYWLLRWHGLPMGFGRCISLTWVAIGFNQLLPGGTGGEAMRAYYIAKDHPGAKGAAVLVVLLDKVIGLAGLLLLGVVPWVAAAALGEGMPGDAARAIRVVGATMAVAFAIGAGLISVVLSPRVDAGALLSRTQARLGPRLGRVVDPMVSLVAVHRGRRARLLGLTVFSTVLHTFSCVTLYVLARAAGDVASFGLHLSLWSVALLTTAIPLSPGGMGVSEAAAAKLWLSCGVTNGAETYLAFRALAMAHAAIGLGVYVMLRRSPTSAPSAASPARAV